MEPEVIMSGAPADLGGGTVSSGKCGGEWGSHPDLGSNPISITFSGETWSKLFNFSKV